MRRKLIICQITLAFLLIVTGTTSYGARAATLRGTLQSDKVELGANLSSESKEILPGERGKHMLSISNLGTDCYVRVSPKLKTKAFTTEDLEFDCGNDWILKNGTYYYSKILKKDKTVGFCESVLIPKDISVGEFSLGYEIDAIQSDNFTPEFTSLNPWGNVEILSVKNRGKKLVVNKVGSNNTEDSLEIHYNEEAKSLITNFDEIFKDIPLIKPGDTYREEIKLKNSGKDAKTLYLSDFTDDSDILKYLDVSIVTKVNGEKKEIFNGNLKEIGNDRMLNAGTLLPKEEGELIITTKMAKEADNEASSLSTHLSIETWAEDAVNFGAKEEIGSVISKDENEKDEELKIRSAKTGDNFEMWKYMILAGVLLIAGVFFLEKKE